MAKNFTKNQVARLCLAVLVLLMVLSFLQQMGWLPLRNYAVVAIYLLIFLLPMIIYIKRRGRKAREMLRLHALRIKYIPFTVVISIAICLICGVLNILGYMVFSSLTAADQPTAMFDFSTRNPLMLVLTMVVLPAVTEELLIRGVVLSEYEQYGTARAVMLSAVIFALFHANPMHFLSLLVAGVCYGLLTLLFDSVWPALIAHLFNNSAALLLYYNKDYISYMLEDPLFLIILLVAVFLIMILALKMLEKIISERGSKGKLRVLHRRSTRSPYRSVCLWLFVIGCVVKAVFTYII